MKTYIEFLLESFLNVMSMQDKRKYIDEVWEILVKTYAYAGGFHTFKNKEDMIFDSYLWKLNFKDGKIVSVIIYKKDVDGNRKSVASALVDPDYKTAHKQSKILDLERAYSEVSGKMEKMYLRSDTDFIKRYRILVKDLPEFIKSKTIDPKNFNIEIYNKIENIDDFEPHDYETIKTIVNDGYHYIRMISGKLFIKSAFGNKNIKVY